MLSTLVQWMHAHERLVWWLVGVSAVTFVGTLIAVPWMVVRIPHDYFRPSSRVRKERHPLMHALIAIGRNVAGYLFLVLGVFMLILPGQGVLTIVAGLALVDFPGKHRLIQWLVARPSVLKSMNWMRERAGRQPLIV